MSEPAKALLALLALMDRLRDPHGGCPWDLEQSFATIAPFTIEEAYEVADAIDRGDPLQLRDELGDLLFQIVFHARLARERGWFDFAQVAAGIHDKLVRRHPHVFGDASAADAQAQTHQWEQIKAQERAARAARAGEAEPGALASVPRALPALARAAKLGRRAARVGFDWSEPRQVRDKVLEELREVDTAIAAASPAGGDAGTRSAADSAQAARSAQPPPAGGAPGSHACVAEEIGDLLFAIANWSLHLGIDPEEALRGANAKFERRFRHMESLARQRGVALEALSAREWDELWRGAKRA